MPDAGHGREEGSRLEELLAVAMQTDELPGITLPKDFGPRVQLYRQSQKLRREDNPNAPQDTVLHVWGIPGETVKTWETKRRHEAAPSILAEIFLRAAQQGLLPDVLQFKGYNNFGARFKNYRGQKLKLTRKQASRILGISDETIKSWETKSRNEPAPSILHEVFLWLIKNKAQWLFLQVRDMRHASPGQAL